MSKFLLSLRQVTSSEELQKLKHYHAKELEQIPNQIFKILIKQDKTWREVYDCLREMYQIQTLPDLTSIGITSSIERVWYFFIVAYNYLSIKMLVEPAVNNGRIKLLLLLLIQNQSPKPPMHATLFDTAPDTLFGDTIFTMPFVIRYWAYYAPLAHGLKYVPQLCAKYVLPIDAFKVDAAAAAASMNMSGKNLTANAATTIASTSAFDTLQAVLAYISQYAQLYTSEQEANGITDEQRTHYQQWLLSQYGNLQSYLQNAGMLCEKKKSIHTLYIHLYNTRCI